MSVYYLVNTVIVGGNRLFPGARLDDAIADVRSIMSAGGVLAPDTPFAAALSARARGARLNRGANEQEMAAIMQAALQDTPTIIFRPGTLSAGNVLGTAAEVKEWVDRFAGAVLLYIDDSIAPAILDVDLDGQGRLVIEAGANVVGTTSTLTVADGKQLKNPRTMRGFLRLQGTPTIKPSIAFDGDRTLVLERGSLLSLQAASTQPLMTVAASAALTLFVVDGALVETNQVGVAVVALGASATLTITLIDALGVDLTDTVSGPASASLQLVHDDSTFTTPTFAGFTGSLSITQSTHADRIAYADNAPVLGGSTMQAAFDALKVREYSPKGADLTDADATIQLAAGRWRVLPVATLSAARVLTLGTTLAVAGDVVTVTRLDVTANTYAVLNGGAGAGTLATFPVSKKAFARFQFDGTDWALREVGSL